MKDQAIRVTRLIGFSWFEPFIRMAAGDDIREQVRRILSTFGISAATLAVFLGLWSLFAARIQTSLGQVPGPAQVLAEARVLLDEHRTERLKKAEFENRQAALRAKAAAENPSESPKLRRYTGKPTYVDQIGTSLVTVFAGFFLASLVAVPLGILCGLSSMLRTALSPLIQIFKPVSPVAWLPIVTMTVSALYTVPSGGLEKSFIISAVTVALCSLWPSLINTAIGVASIDKDYINVSRVLRLGFYAKIFKIVLPSSLPYIFAGLRISLGVGWMVLIASEMLAQNPGLGKFVWDEFQNGSSQSLARILVAVFTIGFIGFLLDRMMVTFQRLFNYGADTIS